MRWSTLQIAGRNLGRNRRRTALAIAAIAVGQLIVVFVNGMMDGMFEDMFKTVTGPLLGHVQVHHKDWQEERAIDLTLDDLGVLRGQLGAIPDVTAVRPRIYAAVLAASGARGDQPADAEAAMIFGVDVDAERKSGGLLEALSDAQVPDDGSVVIGKIVATRLGLKAGDTIALIGQDADEFLANDLFTIKAVVRSGVDAVNQRGIVMPLATAQRFLMLEGKAHEILIDGRDPDDAAALAGRIRSIPALAGAEAVPWRDAVPQLAMMLDMKGTMDLVFVGILFVAAAAGIANTMMMSIFERKHEFGMLLALGARPRRVMSMILLEAVVLGLTGVIVGSILGGVLVGITGQTGIDYGALAETKAEDFGYMGVNFSFVLYPKFGWRHVLYGMIAVTVTSVLTSLWPAAVAARLKPAEAMRS